MFKFISESHLHIVIFSCSLVCSAGWILLCTFVSPVHLFGHAFLIASDGGRGGAIAVAISFSALFANSPLGVQLFTLLSQKEQLLEQIDELRGRKPEQLDDLQKLSHRIDGLQNQLRLLRNQIAIDAEGQDKQNRYISWSAVIGTLSWGFGDWAVWGLQNLFHIRH